MNFTEEQMKKFNEAKSAEELIAFAEKEGLDISEAEIRKYYNATHKCPEGEISDDELDNVAGGACYYSDGRMVTTLLNYCDHWTHCDCGGHRHRDERECLIVCDRCKATSPFCNNCSYCTYENALWLCNHDANRY